MATTTITTTPAQDTRLAVAFGNRLQTRDANGVRRNATQAEIKADLIRYLREVVREEGQAEAARAAVAGVTEIVPT